MANFDIHILSKLEIDTKASRSQINSQLRSKEFKDSLETVKVKMTAGLTKKEQATFRESVRQAIRSAMGGSGDNPAMVKVGIEVDQRQAVKSLNHSLTEAAKQLKSIKVDIDARVDKKTLESQLSGHAPSDSVNRVSGASRSLRVEKEVLDAKREQWRLQQGINQSQRQGVDSQKQTVRATQEQSKAQRQVTSQAFQLQEHYSTTEDVMRAIHRLTDNSSSSMEDLRSHARGAITYTRDMKTDLETIVASVEQYNKNLDKIQNRKITFQQQGDGTFRTTKDSQTNLESKASLESHARAIKLLDERLMKNRKLIAAGVSYSEELKKQNMAIEKQRQSGILVYEVVKKQTKDLDLQVEAHNRIAKAIDRKTKLETQYHKHMQQHSRFIDKRGMKALHEDFKKINTSSTNALTQLRRFELGMKGHVDRAAQATRSQMGIIENFNNAMVKFPIWMGASSLFFGAIRSARAFISNIIEIDSRMITLRKVMSDSADMSRVFRDAEVAAERFGQVLKDVLDAYAEFARQGYEGVDLSNFGNAALIASNVGEISVQTASEYLTAAAAQWQTDSSEAMRQIDSWNEIANNYATTVDKLGEGHAKSAATARAMGLDFHETTAILGALTAQTKQSGSEIGNFIKSAFPRIYAGTGRKVLNDLKIDIETANGETKNAITLLREVAHAMDDLSTSDRADAIRGLGGVWHYQRMQVLLETLRDANGMYDQMLDSSRNSFGSAAAENAVYMESLEARVNKAKVSVEQLSLALGEAFLESGIIESVESFTIVLSSMTGFLEKNGTLVRNLALGATVTTLLHLSRSFRNLNADLGIMLFNLMRMNPLISATNVKLSSMAATAGVSAKALIAVKTAIRGLMVATGVGIAITGVSMALEWFINKAAEGSRASNEFAQSQDVLRQALEADSDRVKDLVKEYEKLENSINSGNYNNEQLEQHKIVTQELTQLFPDLVKGNKDYSDVMAGQQSLMETRIELIEEQIEKERELQAVQQQQRHIEQIEAAKKAQEELTKLLDKDRWSQYLQGLASIAPDMYKEIFSPLEEGLRNITSFDDLKDALKLVEETQEQIDLNVGLGANTQEMLTQDLNLLKSDITLLMNDPKFLESISLQEKIINEGTFAAVELGISKIEDKLSLEGIDASNATGFFGTLLNHTAKVADDFGTLDTVIQAFISSLSSADGATILQIFEDLERANVNYRKVINDVNSTEAEREAATRRLVDTLGDLEGQFYYIAGQAGLTSDQIEVLTKAFNAQIDSQLRIKRSSDGVITNTEDYTNAMLEAENASDGLTDSLDDQTQAFDKLTDALKAADKEMETIAKAMDEINELGALETGTLYDLLDLYPELIGMQMDSAEMIDYLKGKQEDAHQKRLDAFNEEIMQSEAVLQAIIGDEEHKINELVRAYGIDRDEFQNLNEFKEHVSNLITKDQLLNQEDVVNELGKAYGIDMSNFKSLAEKKAAIEAELMRIIVEQWNDYISQLDSEMQSIAKTYRGIKGMDKLDRHAREINLNQSGYSLGDYDNNRTRYDANAQREILGLHQELNKIKTQQLTLDLAGVKYSAKDFNALLNEKDNVVGSSLRGAGDRERERLNNKGSSSGSGGSKGSSPTSKELKDLNIEVERQIKTFQKQTFVLDQYEESLRNINFQLEKQRIKTNSYATHSRNYRKALEEEIKLNKQKLEVMKEQEKSLAQQIKSGNIKRYGMISEDVNVIYNNYSISGGGDGSTGTGIVQRNASGQITPFGNWRRTHSYGARNLFPGETFHHGVDFVAPIGTAIQTPHGGKVIGARYDRLGGNIVSVYNELLDRTFHFGHMLNDLPVKVGQIIQAGATVGYLGNTGSMTTGPHLHFEVSLGKQTGMSRNSTNPLPYLSSMQGSWLGQTGRLDSYMTTGVRDTTGQRLTAERAEYLNALEQAQLDAIEQRINDYNENQQRRSEVHEAQIRLDQLTMDRLNLMAEIRQQIHEITLSHIEEFEVNSNILNHKIAELEYQAEKQSRLLGEQQDSATWRMFMEKALEERKKQTKYTEEQIAFIQKVLAEDKKKSNAEKMSERSRFELEETLRNAKEQLVGLLREEDNALTSIMSSRTDEVLRLFDEQISELDRKAKAIETKRRYIDQTYDDGAKEYRDTIREELELNTNRIKVMEESLVQMRELKKELKEQPELYKSISDKVKELEDSIADAKAEAFELNKEIYTNRVEKAFEGLSRGLEEAQKLFNELQHNLHFIDSDLQKDLYFEVQSNVLVEMDKYKTLIEENIALLENMLVEVEQYPELHKKVTDELKNWKEQHKQVTKEMHTNRKQYTDAFINSIKTIYQKQQELAIKAIDDEYSEFEKMINKKLKLIDEQYNEDKYLEDIADKQSELVKLRTEIAQRMGDDSLHNQAKLKELREELAKQENEYNKFVADKERERRKESLQQELEDAREQADERKEGVQKLFEDMLNDQRKFNEMQEELMRGQVEKYKDLYQNLAEFISENTQDIGRSISEGLLDSLVPPFEALLSLSELLDRVKDTGVMVPESGLLPTELTLPDAISELINGTNNIYRGVSLSSLLPPDVFKPTAPNNTNYNSSIQSLVNIENFTGTQQEKEDLVNTIAENMRKLGVVF